MSIGKSFCDYDFIKFGELTMGKDVKCVVLYARFMRNQDADWTLTTHSHPFYELHFILKGNCKLTLRTGIETALDAGMHILIHPNTNHKFTRFSQDFSRLSIAFDIQFHDKIVKEDDQYILGHSDEKIRWLLEQIMLELADGETDSANIVKQYIYSAMTILLRKNLDYLYDAVIHNDERVNVISEAMGFIQNNVGLEVKAEDVAKSIGMSARQLNRIFRENLNMTVSEFIRNERIMRVREHLIKTDLPLREIAALTGFRDEYVLCKTFKKVMRISLGQYRRECRTDSKREDG